MLCYFCWVLLKKSWKKLKFPLKNTSDAGATFNLPEDAQKRPGLRKLKNKKPFHQIINLISFNVIRWRYNQEFVTSKLFKIFGSKPVTTLIVFDFHSSFPNLELWIVWSLLAANFSTKQKVYDTALQLVHNFGRAKHCGSKGFLKGRPSSQVWRWSLVDSRLE